MYSRPRLSHKIAPCPSAITIGSCSGAHHSGMLVNGCQTNCLSAAIKSFVFQSVMRLLGQGDLQGGWRGELLQALRTAGFVAQAFQPARATKRLAQFHAVAISGQDARWPHSQD